MVYILIFYFTFFAECQRSSILSLSQACGGVSPSELLASTIIQDRLYPGKFYLSQMVLLRQGGDVQSCNQKGLFIYMTSQNMVRDLQVLTN